MKQIRRFLSIGWGRWAARLAMGFVLILWFPYAVSHWIVRANDWVRHTLSVISELENLSSHVAEAHMRQRGYLLLNDRRFLVPYHHSLSDIDAEFIKLGWLVRDNPEQSARLAR